MKQRVDEKIDKEGLTNEHTFALIANLTHQAINPLNGVIGTLDNLIDGTIKETDRKAQRLKSARSQLEYTVSLIRNLAFFTEYGLNNDVNSILQKREKKSSIPQTLIEAAQFFQEQGAKKNIRFEVKDRHISNMVSGPPELLRQVFMNLFDNYVKYAEKDSTVNICQHIQSKTKDMIIRFSGPSTPFSEDDKVFDFGTRGKSAIEKTSAGSGLGLHICRIILEKVFQGTIRAEYIYGKRCAIFEIRIPKAFLTKD